MVMNNVVMNNNGLISGVDPDLKGGIRLCSQKEGKGVYVWNVADLMRLLLILQ